MTLLRLGRLRHYTHLGERAVCIIVFADYFGIANIFRPSRHQDAKTRRHEDALRRFVPLSLRLLDPVSGRLLVSVLISKGKNYALV